MLAEQPSTPAVQPPQPMQPTAPIEKQTVKVALRVRPFYFSAVSDQYERSL